MCILLFILNDIEILLVKQTYEELLLLDNALVHPDFLRGLTENTKIYFITLITTLLSKSINQGTILMLDFKTGY
jgi:hypothetical protein